MLSLLTFLIVAEFYVQIAEVIALKLCDKIYKGAHGTVINNNTVVLKGPLTEDYVRVYLVDQPI